MPKDKLEPYSLGALGMQQVAAARIKVAAAASSASAGTQTVIILPTGCIIDKTVVEIEEIFNCGSPLLSVGYNASVDNLIPSASITAGTLGFYENGTPVMARMATQGTVGAKLSRTGAVGTTGVANVLVYFTRIGEA